MVKIKEEKSMFISCGNKNFFMKMKISKNIYFKN